MDKTRNFYSTLQQHLFFIWEIRL
jgi:hypothetical protein